MNPVPPLACLIPKESPKKGPKMNSNEILQGSDRIRVLVKILRIVEALEEKIRQRSTDRQNVEELKKCLAKHHNCTRNRMNNLFRKAWKLNDMIGGPDGASSEVTASYLNTSSSHCQYKDQHLQLLAEIVERLDRLQKKDQKVDSIPWKNEGNALDRVMEMTGIYELCVKTLLECIGSIKLVRSIPALICDSHVADGISSVEEVDCMIHVLEMFAKKLSNLLVNTRFARTPES